MTRRTIDQAFESLRNKGIVSTLKTAVAYSGYYIRYLYREYSSYGLSTFLGPELTRKIYFVVFSFRCKYNLFMKGDRALWMGKSIKDSVYKITYVNAAEINYEIKGGVVPYIQDGDWDLRKTEFTLNETIAELFIENIPVSETKQYQRMKEAIENGEKAYWCRTLDDIDTYFKILVDTYWDIKNNGYRPHSERKDIPSGRKPGYYPDEVLLAMDRDGNYLLESGGTHRLSIAKLLGIKEIPAVIIRKHYQYVKTKEDWLD